jgi:hypothetical protein
MAVQGPFLLCLLALASLYACTVGAKPSHYSMPFNRSSFPADFIFGVGSAAYQVYMHGLRSTFRLQLGWIFTLHANNKNKNENHIIWTLFPFFASLKEQLISMAGDLAYGILSPRNIQVSLSLWNSNTQIPICSNMYLLVRPWFVGLPIFAFSNVYSFFV